ncbi:hypothetical protein IOD16_30955 [Saccharothrix sp. 6-C]|uniref:hypothetical protein n=1 Tax=Saccharothrix sp. 6-C TaxID=2781735 RepID=UPI0019172ACE|nr:hypothetical protein [Saccharothrix sp. 6-C]QQQ75473.1 hypothetical protein IOD16_30955 [Saccharothrix sp. 6-C]
MSTGVSPPNDSLQPAPQLPPTRYVSPAQRIVKSDHQADGLHPEHRFKLYADLGVHDTADQQAVDTAWDTVYRYFGPFITKVAVDMLADLREFQEAASGRRLRAIFVGRDALALSYAIHQLDPAFHHFFCRELAPVSRAVTHEAIKDAERWWPQRLDAVQGYRYRKPQVQRSRTAEPANWDEMLEYLQIDNIYLDPKDAVDDFVVIDTGYKGSIQEMLAAAYPQVTFRGLYVFHAATSSARSPKKGYVLDLDAKRGFNGAAITRRVVDDPTLTFAHHDGIVAVEEMLSGGLDSVVAADPLEGISPRRIDAKFRSRQVRYAVFTVSQLAVADYAADIRRLARRSGYWYEALSNAASALPRQVHAWLTRSEMDEDLRLLLDSFVRRADKTLVATLADHLRASGRDDVEDIWRMFDECRTMRAKESMVEALLRPPFKPPPLSKARQARRRRARLQKLSHKVFPRRTLTRLVPHDRNHRSSLQKHSKLTQYAHDRSSRSAYTAGHRSSVSLSRRFRTERPAS